MLEIRVATLAWRILVKVRLQRASTADKHIRRQTDRPHDVGSAVAPPPTPEQRDRAAAENG